MAPTVDIFLAANFFYFSHLFFRERTQHLKKINNSLKVTAYMAYEYFQPALPVPSLTALSDRKTNSCAKILIAVFNPADMGSGGKQSHFDNLTKNGFIPCNYVAHRCLTIG